MDAIFAGRSYHDEYISSDDDSLPLENLVDSSDDENSHYPRGLQNASFSQPPTSKTPENDDIMNYNELRYKK